MRNSQAEINKILSLPMASVPHAQCIGNVYEVSVFSALNSEFPNMDLK